MARLIITRQEGNEEILGIEKEEVLIGRDRPGITNDVNLPENTVSRRHARVRRENGHYYVEDLGTVNGTFLNDRRITRAKLTDGDRIVIGGNVLVFENVETKSVNPSDFLVGPPDLRKTMDLNYLILHRLSEMLVTVTSIPDFLEAVMEAVMERIRAARGVLLLVDEMGKLKPAAGRGEVTRSESMVRQSIRERKALLVNYDFAPTQTMAARGVQSAVSAPLVRDGEVIGVIYLEDPLPGRFGESDLVLLTVIANQVASGLEKVALKERLHTEARIRTGLERFMSPRVVEMITRDCVDLGDIRLKTEKLRATILFSDIRGFTLLSERLDPEEVVDLLTRYFSLMTEAVFAWDGTLDKYMGDGLLAVFGAPFPLEDHAARAVRCALQMLEEQARLSESLPPEKRFSIRIGINTGEVVAGYIGSPRRMEYTALGETVIIANRLESLADPGTIYMGKDTFEMIRGDLPAEFVGKITTPKGAKEIDVYRLAP